MPIRTLPTRKALVALTLVASGVVAGGAALVTTASADSPSPSPSSSASADTGRHSGETELTGTTLTKVKGAVLVKYPNATFHRVETDRDGVYEAHIITAAGDRVTVELDKSYAITGTETGHGRGGKGGGGKGGGAGETALSGTTLTKVKVAVLVKYPNATFDRVETDRDGVYEAHINTAAGDRVTVELDKNYAITGTE